LAKAVLHSVSPPSQRRSWILLASELVLVMAISLYVSGLPGLAGLAAGLAEDAAAISAWMVGSAPAPPPPSPADVPLLLAFIALVGLASWHLALLARQPRPLLAGAR
jgi:hypothetical protein